MESLGYVLLYLACGSLPWQGLKAATDQERKALVQEKKMSLSGRMLCEGLLPDEFATYIDYTRSLGFQDKPDYAYRRQLFRRLFHAKGFKYDNIFDWTEKRFYEIHGTAKPTSSTPRPGTAVPVAGQSGIPKPRPKRAGG